MTQPTYPLVLVYNNRVLHILSTEIDLAKPAPFNYVRSTDQEVAYDGNGNKWTYRLTSNQSDQFQSGQLENNLSKRLLLYLLPSPVIIVKPEWTKQGTYQLEELKQVIIDCISNAEDVVIPFSETDSPGEAISQAKSFGELLQNLINYGLNVGESNLWREQKY